MGARRETASGGFAEIAGAGGEEGIERGGVESTARKFGLNSRPVVGHRRSILIKLLQ